MIMYPLHRVVFSGIDGHHSDLYLHSGGEAISVNGAAGVSMQPGRCISTDTYFGVFPFALWRRVGHITDVQLSILGTGKCFLKVRTVAECDRMDHTLLSVTLDLHGATCLDLTEALLGTAGDAIYIQIIAIEQLVIESISFATSEPPRRVVSLGLIITTFGRQLAVKDSVDRLQTMISSDPEKIYGTLKLVVVDNGRDLDPDHFEETVILPNPNVGGAGGFARGLSYLDDQGFSHGCFMDDDAATEDECILRTRRLLAYAVDETSAVSAAMLRAETSYMVHEQGALFDWNPNHRIVSRKYRSNLLTRKGLFDVLQPEDFCYGGWWFFAFPIVAAIKYPYPLFVRGDDWLFSYFNRFKIEVMPGVASWQDGFEGKISPIEQYLAMKAFLVAELMLREPPSATATATFFGRWVCKNIFGYCYDRAQMNLDALKDTMSGPEFWEKNVALGPRLAALRTKIISETYQDLAGASDIVTKAPARSGLLFNLARALTLNGHLVPQAFARLFAVQTVDLPLSDAPMPRTTFLRQTIRYIDPITLRGFVASKDAARCFSQLSQLVFLLTKLIWHYGLLRSRYIASKSSYCKKAWWDNVNSTSQRPKLNESV